jgi:hypothetical protein
MRTISGSRGNTAITGLAAFLGAVIFFLVLYGLYAGINDVAARSSAVREAGNVAAVLDSVGSAPAYCRVKYLLPDKLFGRAYLLHISGNHVTISLSSPAYNGSAIFLTNLSDDFSASGGVNLTITKNNTVFEVTN